MTTACLIDMRGLMEAEIQLRQVSMDRDGVFNADEEDVPLYIFHKSRLYERSGNWRTCFGYKDRIEYNLKGTVLITNE